MASTQGGFSDSKRSPDERSDIRVNIVPAYLFAHAATRCELSWRLLLRPRDRVILRLRVACRLRGPPPWWKIWLDSQLPSPHIAVLMRAICSSFRGPS
jgi:hypothetical protein